MNILGGAKRGFGGILGGGRKGFQKDLRQADFTGVATADVDLDEDIWTLVGYYKIPAQQMVRIGYGRASEPQNQGYMYIRLDGSGGAITGMVRIKIESANGERSDMVGEWNLISTAGDKNLKDKMIALPEDIRFQAKEDDKILIEIKTDNVAADGSTIDYDDTDNYIKIPTTAYYLG